MVGDDVNDADANEDKTGVKAGEQLREFADAVLSRDEEKIAINRKVLLDQIGKSATVDVAATVANFQRMVRIADGTGIPLDEPVVMMSQDIRADLGINDYRAAAHTPELSLVKRFAGRILAPFLPMVLQRMVKRRSASQNSTTNEK